MAYGDPIATISTYGDDVFCLRCATFIYTNMADRKENAFFSWVRDLNVQEMYDGIGGDEIARFVRLVDRQEIRDGLSADPTNRIRILREGQDQGEINVQSCNKCLVQLECLCIDYP